MVRLTFFTAVALMVSTSPAADPEPKKKDKEPDSYLKVEAKGKLRTGIMAIGGETTGVMIATPGGTFEVQLPRGTDADKLDGKTVKVYGSLIQRKGVTVRGVRTIIEATKMEVLD
ncbi:MAG: hypothetical protein SNJ75_06810 [Gemmataceae bacterium]